MTKKIPQKTQMLPTDLGAKSISEQDASDVKPGDVKSAQGVSKAQAKFADELLDAALNHDVLGANRLLDRWKGTKIEEIEKTGEVAQEQWNTLWEGVGAISNFLRKFGAGEQDPKLYTNLMSLDAPKDAPFDAAALEVKADGIKQTGQLLKAVEDLASVIGDKHLDGTLDLSRGDTTSLKNIMIAENLGMATDALKVKMAGWNKLTPKLDTAQVSFELGIRKLPKDTNTNFWVVGGVNKTVEWISNLKISPQAVEWMKGHELFSGYPQAFFDYFSPPTDDSGQRIPGEKSQFEKDLKSVKIDALQDGEIYAGGPIMRVSGPPAAVEFLETNIMRLVTSWTTVATAASQMTLGADGKPVAYFGPRRAPGGEDTTLAISDAAALGGMTVTSDLLGGFMGNPITGTMEHSIMLMLKTVFKHDPPREFTAEEKKDAAELLRNNWKTAGLSDADIEKKVDAQLDDVLTEAYIFENYSMEYDKSKSVALVDTSDPNVGIAAAMLAQKWAWAKDPEGEKTDLFAVRLDSGSLLGQGLQFHRAMRSAGMEHIKILATDGLLPETVKFFEQVEDALHAAGHADDLPKSVEALIQNAPKSVADNDEEKAMIIDMARNLVKSGGLPKEMPLFAAYGAGEKIADSVSTVGRPGIVYKASELTFEGPEGDPITVNMGKVPTPDKATGPNRELVAKYDKAGQIEQYVIVSPEELDTLGPSWQRQMRTVMDAGRTLGNTSHKSALEFSAKRRDQIPDAIKDGGKVPIGMSQGYKNAWSSVVAETDATKVPEFQAYFDKMWDTVDVTS